MIFTLACILMTLYAAFLVLLVLLGSFGCMIYPPLRPLTVSALGNPFKFVFAGTLPVTLNSAASMVPQGLDVVAWFA